MGHKCLLSEGTRCDISFFAAASYAHQCAAQFLLLPLGVDMNPHMNLRPLGDTEQLCGLWLLAHTVTHPLDHISYTFSVFGEVSAASAVPQLADFLHRPC